MRNLICGRARFNGQAFLRDAERVGSTPDHLLLHLYRSGGFCGRIGGREITLWAGQVALIDLGQPVAMHAATASTLFLVLPRTVLAGVDVAAIAPRLDRRRNALLAARMIAFHAEAQHLPPEATEPATERFVAAMATLLDETGALDRIEDPIFDDSLLAMAEQAIQRQLASPALAPDGLAAEVGISRATLYRIFAPQGGVMRSVQEQRLLAARTALGDPLETRSIARLGADCGFTSEAHFSRSFRKRFGTTAGDFRAEQVRRSRAAERTHAGALHLWWNRIGRSVSREPGQD